LEEIAAITAGGKRAVILEAIEAHLDAEQPTGAIVHGGSLHMALRQAQIALANPARVTLHETAAALRRIVDAACEQAANAVEGPSSLATVATAKDARRLAAQLVSEADLAGIRGDSNFDIAYARQIVTWARAWLTTAIASSLGNVSPSWEAVVNSAEHGRNLDRDIERGRMSKLARDWKLTPWRDIPEAYKQFILPVICSAIERSAEWPVSLDNYPASGSELSVAHE
jgi:hypothetical protein